MAAQQAAEAVAAVWALEWAAFAEQPVLEWPPDLKDELVRLPRLHISAFRRALASFPDATGLGWDDLHPKALLRLDDTMLAALLRILFLCECRGTWPASTAIAIVALIPKTDGGRRPIGLLPLLPRIWMRARHDVIRDWERANDRDYLYAGPSKGAQVATWKQAARAELAQMTGEQYAQVLLDLVKAFDRVP